MSVQRECASPLVAPSQPLFDEKAAAAKKRRSQRLGTLLVIVVVCLYVGSGVMIQVLFDELQYEKPFFFSFVSVGLCSTYLLHPLTLECWRYLMPPRHGYSKVQTGGAPAIGSPLHLLRPALLLAPSYFCLNYTYFFSLDLTSVSSTMILSASTGVWTLLFSRLLLGETLTRLKMATVCVSLLGMSLVIYSTHGGTATPAWNGGARGVTTGSAATHTKSTSGAHSRSAHAPASSPAAAESNASGATGDLLALMSAAASGVYMVLLPVCVPEKDAHMPSLFGMMGVVCTLAVLPLFPLLHYGGVESLELPPTRSATAALLINAATSTVLPDMLLAKAIMMTSPLVATLGLSLMIPFSVFADYMRGLAHLSPQFFIGTFAVFVGFVLETMAEGDGVKDGDGAGDGDVAKMSLGEQYREGHEGEGDGDGDGDGDVDHAALEAPTPRDRDRLLSAPDSTPRALPGCR